MIVGHEEAIRDLRARADASRLGQAWLFFGPKGVGKATVARSLARYLETGEFADTGRMLSDALFVLPEGDSRSIGIDAARRIRMFLSETAATATRRTVVIEAGEALTPEAENALLKVAEEPPAAALLIVIVDDPERLLPTLRSRFSAMHFGAVPALAITAWLEERGVGKRAAEDAARRSFGAPGLAVRILEDEQFAARRASAEKLIALPVASRKAFVKDLSDDDTFHAEDFLETLMLVLAWGKEKKYPVWHRVLELRANLNSYNLNPRLHLTALAQYL